MRKVKKIRHFVKKKLTKKDAFRKTWVSQKVTKKINVFYVLWCIMRSAKRKSQIVNLQLTFFLYTKPSPSPGNQMTIIKLLPEAVGGGEGQLYLQTCSSTMKMSATDSNMETYM